MLESISKIVKVGGRISIITFHSLEDRIVKNYMKYGEFEEQPTTDIFGKRKEWHWKVIAKKAIAPSAAEIKQNSRSRSAKLRVMEKLKN
jgi:16S rRNA (cytosine1402-N4)-methyltransferase